MGLESRSVHIECVRSVVRDWSRSVNTADCVRSVESVQLLDRVQLGLSLDRRMHPNRGKITELDVDEDVTLVEAKEDVNANVRGGMTYNDIRPIFEKHYNSLKSFLEKGEKDIKEENKRKGKNLNQDAAKKQRIDKEVEELKTHLQIIANNDDDVYTEATPLALKVPVVDYQIHHEHNKPYYKIIRVVGNHQLFLSFVTLLKNFDREDLEMLWKLVQERFQSSEPKNFLDDFLLNTLKIMFKKPNVEASIWRDQKGKYRLAKVKSWKLFKSYGVHIITFTTT
nr:hypothetical protein [Tanacetum cinerariifolium]